MSYPNPDPVGGRSRVLDSDGQSQRSANCRALTLKVHANSSIKLTANADAEFLENVDKHKAPHAPC